MEENYTTGTKSKLFGTLEIEGVGTFYAFAEQSRTITTWALTERTVFDNDPVTGKGRGNQDIVAIVRVHSTGKILGYGKTYLLTRMLDHISSMVGRVRNDDQRTEVFVSGEYTGDNGEMIKYKASYGGTRYLSLQMAYEGFKLAVEEFHGSKPFKYPQLYPIADERTKAAMVAGLGVRTFALLKRQRGHDLDWYDSKDYKLVTSNEQWRQIMLEYLRAVQQAANENKSVLTGLDTETTGLNMYDLARDNPNRDHVVAIPFGWENDKGYVICTDMHYFGNVDADEVYPIFQTLFCRNPDYSYQDISLDYCGEHFEFSRRNITLVGANVDFDIRAFATEDCDVFFDEDIQKIHYNLATDWVQGRNSLKWMTHHYLNVQTLELEDLFGPQHKDKYRYISDPDLAVVYGGADADYPRQLFRLLRPLLPDNLYFMYKKYDMTAVYQTAKATWRGMTVDEKQVRAQGDLVMKDLEKIKEFIYRYAYSANRNYIGEKSNKLTAQLASLFGVSEDVLLADSKDEISDGDEGLYRYPFTPANHKHLLFNILHYPVVKVSEKSQEPALDKFVLKKLAERKREQPVEFLKQDIMSEANPGEVLISKADFNSDAFPLARVFIKYSEINKEYTAYYKPIMDNDMEGRMFYNFSLQRAATRRILSPGQTMKGSLKQLVIAPPKKLYMCFDASQIEYRHMASLAYIQTKKLLQQSNPDDWEQKLAESGIARIHRMMQGKEADYHIETASMMTGLPQYKIDHKTRKMYKSIGFGIPYGLGDRSMCESLFGKITPENMVKTKETLDDYKNRQFEIIRLLETVRDSAFVPATIPDKFREMLSIGDTPVGIVRNFVGFYRMFILENRSRAMTSRIRRQAGNCVIQGGAAELFRRMIYNLYIGCVEAGYGDKVLWQMLVHDEVDTVVDDDCDVCKLIDIISTGCTLKYEDHIPYYVGIGFGYNWLEAKDDSAELPVIMVDRLVSAYRAGKFSIPSDGNQPKNLLKLKRHYMCDRVGECLAEIIPGIGPGYQWTSSVVEKVSNEFTNYVVRSYLTTFCTKEDKKQYGKDIPLDIQLKRWQAAREEYGFGKDFLSEKFQDMRQCVHELNLDGEVDDGVATFSEDGFIDIDVSDDDLGIELLDNESEETEDAWFSEDSLFDYNVSSDEIVTSEGDSYAYRSFTDEEEDTFVENPNPTNAFDVLVSTQYIRKKILNSGDGVYTVMLNGTTYAKQVNALVKVIKDTFGTGSSTVVLIGDSIKRISNVDCDSAKLDRLDKIICGESTTEG